MMPIAMEVPMCLPSSLQQEWICHLKKLRSVPATLCNELKDNPVAKHLRHCAMVQGILICIHSTKRLSSLTMVIPKHLMLDIMIISHKDDGKHLGLNKTCQDTTAFVLGRDVEEHKWLHYHLLSMGELKSVAKRIPAQMWGVEILWPFPQRKMHIRYIILAINFGTQFCFGQLSQKATTKTVISFVENEVLTCFGY